MKKPLRVENAAARELEEAILWYERRLPGLGLRFLMAVQKTLKRLEAFPKSGTQVPRLPRNLAVRRFRVKEFPFQVICLETEEELWVLAFAHERRRPGYWKRRARHTQRPGE